MTHLDGDARILTFFLGYATCFVLLSVNSEGIFYVIFSGMLSTWMEAETSLRRVSNTGRAKAAGAHAGSNLDDVRIAIFYLFFVHVAYFGMGK